MDLLKLRATLGIDTSDYEKGLENAKSNVSGLGSALSTGLKAGVAAIGAATVAVGALVKKSVDSYAEFQQLEGGIQKLFGEEASERMMNYAKNAYQTAGMSANQYMEQSTSFAAALINSLEGDTVKAADQADLAMRAISDNFNTFGGDIQNVQNAFQGFAKQNYTMLDNLKLGYGGTKTEMQRLIDDANEYAESIGKASDLSIDSFSDIVTAIDLIQQKQHIAGTTAKEAGSTISGSVGSVKAAWENLVTGMSDPNADIGVLIQNVVDTATTSLNNLMPTIERALNGVVTLVSNIAPLISERLPDLMSNILPSLISAATSLVVGLVSALPGILSALVQAMPEVARQIVSSLQKTMPTMIGYMYGVGKGMFNNLLKGIREKLPQMIPVAMNALMKFSGGLRENVGKIVDAGLELITALAEALISGLPVFIQTIPTIVSNIAGIINDNAPKILETVWNIIKMLAQGIADSWPIIVEEFPKIIKAIVDVWQAINWLNLGVSVITNIAGGIATIAGLIPDAISAIVLKAVDIVRKIDWLGLGASIINFIVSGIRSLFDNIPSLLHSIGDTAVTTVKSIDWAGLGNKIINFIVSGLQALFVDIPNKLKSIGDDAWNKFKDIDWKGVGSKVINFIVGGLAEIGANIKDKLKSIGEDAWNAFSDISWTSLGSAIIDGILGGIGDGDSIFTKLKNIALGALHAAEEALGIKSPSRRFRDEVGKMIPAGIAVGIDDNTKDVTSAIQSMSDAAAKSWSAEFENPSIPYSESSSVNNIHDQSQVYKAMLYRMDRILGVLEYYLPKRVFDGDALTDVVSTKINKRVRELDAVW